VEKVKQSSFMEVLSSRPDPEVDTTPIEENLLDLYPLKDDATPLQKRYIALLCWKCGIKEPLEDGPVTKLEAGELIEKLRLKRKLLGKKGR